MEARSFNSRFVEALEGRSLMSTVVSADFNNDGRPDTAAITSPTTITVSLAQTDGTFKVSAVLTTPKNRPATDISAVDIDSDGDLDVYAFGGLPDGSWYRHSFLNNGDGTFGARTTETIRVKQPHGGIW
jgi:hypothetical protein